MLLGDGGTVGVVGVEAGGITVLERELRCLDGFGLLLVWFSSWARGEA